MAVILVVDDERTIAETVAELLTWEGHEVLTASDGLRAVETLEGKTVDLLVVDFMMPLMSGVEVVRHVRATPRLERLPVILMTAAPASLPGGPPPWNHLLVKPFAARDLTETVRRALPGKRRS